MKRFGIRTVGRSLFLCLIAFGFIALARAEARADEVYIAGFTNGCFGAGCVPSSVAPPIVQSANTAGLFYTNSTFTGTTADGFRGLGGNPTPGANVNNLGSLELLPLPATYNTSFTLLVTFTAPQGIIDSNMATFTAAITGTVRSDNTGGVFVDFDNTPITFFFNDRICEPNPEVQPPSAGQTTCGPGSFKFSVNDVSIDPGQTVSITGQVTGASTVPEPMTMVLFGTGLSGIAAARRRRRSRGQ